MQRLFAVALLLLSTGLEADTALVESHLRWLWLRNERPDGRWLRSHHANGKRKEQRPKAARIAHDGVPFIAPE